MEENLHESFDQQLLDYHMGLLGEDQAARVEAAIEASPDLAAQSRVLSESLHPLDSWEVAWPSANLNERILDRVAAERTLSFAEMTRSASVLPSGAEAELSASPFVSIRELVAIAACITVFAGIFVPGYYRAKSIAHRTICADHLRELTTAASLYAQDNAGALPFAGAVQSASWLPVKTPGVRVVSNKRHPYLLMKLAYVKNPRTFLCPSRQNDLPMEARSYESFNDFPESSNISFAYQNMNGGPLARTESIARMALMSDQNPLFDGGRIQSSGNYEDNSLVHGNRSGQNVAFVDGSAQWTTTPAVGIGRDHIFRARGITRYTGTEVPQSATDSFLIP